MVTLRHNNPSVSILFMIYVLVPIFLWNGFHLHKSPSGVSGSILPLPSDIFEQESMAVVPPS